MPWKETSVMDSKVQLIGDYLSNSYPLYIMIFLL